MKKSAALVCALLVLAFFNTASPASGSEKVRHLAVHVDQDDPKVMNLALNNIQNLKKHYGDKGEKIVIELVAYGPGLHMLRADTSPVKDRIATMSLENEDLTFSACMNTRKKMAAASGKEVPILSEAQMVPSGVVQLLELQEDGYKYIRP
ncbi:DsrE family protein [Nisaea sediminum]|uniref:DsrE family protein n=1 Tax=Nisaea sediminum TaxID=2775867 RepID=UPI001868C1BB|nr:DsrE family protein [Nisaea sediminum]